MKKLTACAAMAALLIVPAEAVSATKKYKGTADADPATAVTLKVKKEDGKRYLTFAKAQNLAISCNGGATQARLGFAQVRPDEKIKKGRFDAKEGDGLRTIVVEGKVAGPTITGTFRYYGFTNVDGQTMGCDSGKVAFTARK